MTEFFTNVNLTFFDWIILIWLIVIFPIDGFIASKWMKPSVINHQTNDKKNPRLFTHIYSITTLWLPAIAALYAWNYSGRDWADMGLQFNWSLTMSIVIAICVLTCCAHFFQLYLLVTNENKRFEYNSAVDAAGDAMYFMPRTKTELGSFSLLGTTAGITEEILFRGFLIWALDQFLPLYAAAFMAWGLFVILHLYQGWNQIPIIAFAGGVITIMYIACGSILPLMVFHILIDIVSGFVFWIGTQKTSSPNQAPTV